MSKSSRLIAALIALSAPVGGAWAVTTGTAVEDPAACRAGSQRPAVLVKVNGFKAIGGFLRVQVYGGDPAQFVKGGERLARIELPVRAAVSELCVALPAPGRYAIAVRHDLDGNGKSGWNDGGGFSRNPQISFVNLKPKHRDVVIRVGNGVRPVDVVLNYRQGLNIGPIGRK